MNTEQLLAIRNIISEVIRLIYEEVEQDNAYTRKTDKLLWAGKLDHVKDQMDEYLVNLVPIDK